MAHEIGCDVYRVMQLLEHQRRNRRVESGPGINPRPDNSVAHLDVDLLCDDA